MTNGRRGFATSNVSDRARDALAERKSALRQAAKRRRQAAHDRQALSAGTLLSANFVANVTVEPGAVVAGYVPIRDEIDVLPLLSNLSDDGHRCALPVVRGPENPLIFRVWRPGAPLSQATFGTSVPLASAAEVAPDVVLVPMLAFDAACRRIGYGAGYYDRTIAGLRAAGPVLAVGIAYGDQQVDEVPADEFDQVLDLIVTERSVFRRRD